MAVVQTSPDQTTPLVAEPLDEELVVEQQKLSPRLQAYIKLLSDGQPLRQIDIRVARHRVAQELEPRWPKHPGWETERKEVFAAIDEAVKSMPASGPTSAILLRITLGSQALLPAALLEVDESVAVVSFDSIEGTKRQCTILQQEKVENPDAGI